MAESPIIERIGIENLGCIKSIDVELATLHAFIGPNDMLSSDQTTPERARNSKS